MSPQSQFSTLDPVPQAASDVSACYLHGPDNSVCFFPDEPFLGEQTNSLPPDDIIWYDDDDAEQSCASVMPATSGLPTIHVVYPNTTAVFGYSDSDYAQSTANDYGVSQYYYYPNSGFDIPAQPNPAVIPVQATEVSVPAGDLEPFSRDARSVATSIGFPVTFDMAGFPPEVSQTPPFPIQFANTATLGSPQVTSQPYQRPCEWRGDQGGICGQLVGLHCEDHLSTVHGIVDISASTLVTCGACGKTMKRKSILRHFRERHLRFRRSK